MLSILHYFDLVPRSRFGGSKTKKGGGGEGKGEEEKEIWQNTIAWVRTVAMATVVSQHARHFGRLLGFFKKIILRKIAASFTEINRKHVFPASNRNIIENKV